MPWLSRLEAIGWHRAVLPKSRYPLLAADSMSIDYSGWPLYTRASLPDEDAYRICAAIAARVEEIPWDPDAFTGLDQLGRVTDSTPLDVPLHPGAERWFKEQGYEVYEAG